MVSEELMNKIRDNVGRIIKMKAIQLCPIDNGDMRMKIDYRVEGEYVVITCDDPNANFVEYGTGIYHLDEVTMQPSPKPTIKPKNAGALAWVVKGTQGRPAPDDKEAWKALRKSGKAIVVKEVKGQKPQPFIRPAIHQSIPEIQALLNRNI